MAGAGRRFKKGNYSTIKPLVLVDNETILEKSLKNLPKAKSKYVILNDKIYKKKKILQNILKKYNFQKFLIKKKTLGQSDTVNKIKKLIKSDDDCLVHSCDYILKYNFRKFAQLSKKCDVIVFVTKLKSKIVKDYNSFAYCKTKKGGKIEKIVEKKTISKNPKNDYTVVGTFWFNKISDCFYSHDAAIKNNDRINNEYYIGNNLNYLIKLGRKIKIFEVDTWINLGDIYSYKEYIYWKNFFNKNIELKLC